MISFAAAAAESQNNAVPLNTIKGLSPYTLYNGQRPSVFNITSLNILSYSHLTIFLIHVASISKLIECNVS